MEQCSKERLGFRTSSPEGTSTAKSADAADPDRLPELKAGTKLLSFEEVIEIEKRKARARHAARTAADAKP